MITFTVLVRWRKFFVRAYEKARTFASGLPDGIIQNDWKVIRILFGPKHY
jgi:hypothetical protein